MAIDGADGGGDGRGGARAKIPRLNKEGDGSGAVGAEAVPVSHISKLPEDLHRSILKLLPLKDAIRMGSVDKAWKSLWKEREKEASLVVRLNKGDTPQVKLDELEVKKRLECFSLVYETRLKKGELEGFVKYAAVSGVVDFRAESQMRSSSDMLSFPVPKSSRALEHLTVRNFRISNKHYTVGLEFRALEVIRLHYCSISNNRAFERLMKVSPSLRILDLRCCNFYERWDVNRWEHEDGCLVMPPNLRSITMAECVPSSDFDIWKARLDLVRVPGLRSFRYSGDFIASRFTLPRDAALDDLYVQFSYSSEPTKYNDVKLNESLPEDLSRLKVLTISCNALPGASSLPDGGASARLPDLSLPNLTELQVLMFGLEAANLVGFYKFLKTRQCTNLERLFVQLPASGSKSLEGSADEVGEEPQEIALDKLVMVKVMNFNWGHAEVQLVKFLLRKATSLRELFLVSPNGNPLDFPIEQDAVLKEALDNGKILLRDDSATRPYHSEVLVKL